MVKGNENVRNHADEMAQADKLRDEELQPVTGGNTSGDNYQAGIGPGNQGSVGNITIRGGEIRAGN